MFKLLENIFQLAQEVDSNALCKVFQQKSEQTSSILTTLLLCVSLMSLSHRPSLSHRTMEKVKRERDEKREKRRRVDRYNGRLCACMAVRTWGGRSGGSDQTEQRGKAKEREWKSETAGGMNKPSSAHLHQAQPHKDGPVPQKGEKTNTTHLERSASEPLLYTPLFPGYPTPPEAGLMDIPAIFSSLSSLSGDYTSTWTTLYKDYRGPLEEKAPLRQAQCNRCVHTWVWMWQSFSVVWQ